MIFKINNLIYIIENNHKIIKYYNKYYFNYKKMIQLI
jgi:hypothetical protein